MTDMNLSQALSTRRSCRKFSADCVPFTQVQNLLKTAQASTSLDGHRAAPSAHALYPLRFHVVAARILDLASGLYEIDPTSGALNRQTEENLLPALEAAALEDQPWIGDCAFALAISANVASARQHFADQPPPGERGFRYVLIEAGATAQNLLLQITAAKLGAVLVAGFDDSGVAKALSLKEGVEPIALICAGIPAVQRHVVA